MISLSLGCRQRHILFQILDFWALGAQLSQAHPTIFLLHASSSRTFLQEALNQEFLVFSASNHPSQCLSLDD